MTGRLRGVVVVGHATIDDIRHEGGEHLPGTLGGAAVYATLAAATCGARVRLITRVGDDYPLDRLERTPGVDVGAVRRIGPRSVHNITWYRADGSRRFEIEDWDLMERLTPVAADLEGSDLTGTIVLLAPGQLDLQLELLDAVRARGGSTAVDTELHYLRDAGDTDRLRAVLARADVALPSIEHLQALFDSASRDPLDYATDLAALGCGWVAVKQGREGCTLLDCASGRHWAVPAVAGVAVRDPTGAGDGFNGGFVAAAARGDDLLTAVCWGTVAASYMVECVGARRPDAFTHAGALARFAEVRSAVPPSLNQTTRTARERD